MVGGSRTSDRYRCDPPEIGRGFSMNWPSISTSRIDSGNKEIEDVPLPNHTCPRTTNSAAVPTPTMINGLILRRPPGASATSGERQTNHPKPTMLTATAKKVIEMPDDHDDHDDNPAPITAPRPMANPTSPPVGASLWSTFPSTIERRWRHSAESAECRHRPRTEFSVSGFRVHSQRARAPRQSVLEAIPDNRPMRKASAPDRRRPPWVSGC